jgi:hypothetical protein
MRNRPKILLAITFIFLGIIVSLPVQVALLYGHAIDELVQMLTKISLLNLLVALSLVLNIPFILRASRWLSLSLPFSLIAIGWNNWVVASVGHDFSPSTTWVATLLFALLCGFVSLPVVWNLIKNPEQRWWLQAVRKAISLPMTLEPVRGSSIDMRTFDLSNTGAFVQVDDWSEFEYPMREGDVINVKFTIGTLNRISCSAQIVRRNYESGHYPAGLGLRFIGLQRGHHRLLRQFVETQPDQVTH